MSDLTEVCAGDPGSDGGFEVDPFAVEARRVIALAGDRRSLAGDQGRQIAADPAAL